MDWNMPRASKRIPKKLKALEEAFCSLPAAHRNRHTWQGLAKVSGVAPERAEEHFRLALAMIESGVSS